MRRGARPGWALVIGLLSGCAGDKNGSEQDVLEEGPALVEPDPDRAVALLSRASLDLRGVRPSLDELQQVADDPAALDGLLRDYVNSPALGWRYAEMMSGVFLTPLVEADYGQATYPVDNELALLQSMGEEPLRLLAAVLDEDLPYTALVTADWTMVNEHLAAIYPSDYPAGATGWRRARYTDGRPAVGVLATNGFYWRYSSTQANANRGRANAVSRIFTCRDYLDAVIEGNRELNLLDEAAVSDALRTDPACVSCHASIDPLAAYFWGFYNHFNFSPAEQSHYHAERELDWRVYTGVGPGYYGAPGGTLTDLGQHLAADPAYVECAVERTLEQLLARPVRLADTEALTAHREVFLSEGLRLRALVESVVRDPAYAPAADPEADPADDPRASAPRLLSAAQLRSSLADATGYVFEAEGLDVFAADLYGIRTLAGGLEPARDSERVVAPSSTGVLVQLRMAEAAADYAVRADLIDLSAARLLPAAGLAVGPEDPAFAPHLVALHLRLHGQRVEADGPEVLALTALYDDIFALTGESQVAWTGLLTAMLRDPAFFIY
jgi:hypothetical protein